MDDGPFDPAAIARAVARLSDEPGLRKPGWTLGRWHRFRGTYVFAAPALTPALLGRCPALCDWIGGEIERRARLGVMDPDASLFGRLERQRVAVAQMLRQNYDLDERETLYLLGADYHFMTPATLAESVAVLHVVATWAVESAMEGGPGLRFAVESNRFELTEE